MPLWQWLLDAAGVLLGLVLLYGVALVIRRRVLSRNGGTFELSYRVRPEKAGRGWLLGLGRYSGDDLEWFRIFSLSPRPKRVWRRPDLTFDGRREPEGVEQMSLYPDHVVVQLLDAPTGTLELAMGQPALTGFQAWLEAGPPRADPAAVTAPHRSTVTPPSAPSARSRWSSSSTASASPAWSPGSRTSASDLDLGNGALGLLLLAIAAGLGAGAARPAAG